MILSVKNLTKKFGDFTAVNNISFSIKKGEIFGLLGPNGAGKTTTIKMICGLIKPTSGEITIDGINALENPLEAKKLIGWMSAESILDEDLTVWENMEVQAKLHNFNKFEEKAEELLKYFDIYNFSKSKVSNLSTGMRKKLEIAMALINDPSILVLDEPTIALDPNTRAALWEVIERANKERKVTVLLTTHYMDEADRLCDRIAIIDHGKIIANDSPSNLKKKYGNTTLEIKTKKEVEIKGYEYQKEGNNYIISVKDLSNDISKIIKLVGENNIISINVNNPSLDNVFLRLTGRKISEEKTESTKIYRILKSSR